MSTFSAKIQIIDINPYVKVPDAVVRKLLDAMKKTAGPIPVKGKLNGRPFSTTVVKFRGMWRLYLNTPMRRAANLDVGDRADVEIQLDQGKREEPFPPKFTRALAGDRKAKAAFEKLIPSRQKEILRYLNHLKREETLERNIEKVIQFLSGEKVEGLIVATYAGGRKSSRKK
jgi:hypothetical protein